jgi:hypothetical protein
MLTPMNDREFQEFVPVFMLHGAEDIVSRVSLMPNPEKARGLLVELRGLLDRYAAYSPEFADMSRDVRGRVSALLLATLLEEDQP